MLSFFKSLVVTLILFTCFSANQAFANKSGLEKQYVSSDQVLVSEDGTFVIKMGELYPVSCIMQDSQGIYYVELPLGYWKCSNGHPNPPWRLTCAVPGCSG